MTVALRCRTQYSSFLRASAHFAVQVAFCAALFPCLTFACPRIDGLIDYNCDGILKIVFTGDSIVDGVGDTKREHGGGYVVRLQDKLPDAAVENLGVPGITTKQLLRAFKKNLNKVPPGPTIIKSAHADVLIIDVGRNDYWDRESASKSVANIRRLVQYLRTTLAQQNGMAPYIFVSTLIPTKRGYQQPFINSLNSQLLKYRSSDLPTYVRYETIANTLLSKDGLHPTSAGYDAITKLLLKFIKTEGQKLIEKKRPDGDHDGVYDIFETNRFLTNPLALDSDSDSLSDGAEIFTYFTNPLVLDTDGDGRSDGAEVASNTNPLVID